MKKNIPNSHHLLALIFLLIGLVSCGIVSTPKGYTSSPNLDITEPNVNRDIRWVDLEINMEKVQGKAKGKLSANYSIYDLKDLALGNAILESKCDLIVAPFFIVELNGSIAEVTAYGFPAKYKIE